MGGKKEKKKNIAQIYAKFSRMQSHIQWESIDIISIFSIFAGTIVFIGVKFVNKFAAVALTCVICSIIAVYVGIFDNFNGNEKLQ